MLIDKIFGASWKTTVLGLISGFCSLVKFEPSWFGGDHSWVSRAAIFVLAGGLAGLGIIAKDYNVTGGTKQNTNRPH
jgi:hypothetical protein